MDLQTIKFHLLELIQHIQKEPNNPIFLRLWKEADTLLNSHPLKDTKDITPVVPIIAMQIERKRRQAIEKLLKQIEKNPAYPAKVKADIVKSHEETMKKYRMQMKNLRQIQKQSTSEAG